MDWRLCTPLDSVGPCSLLPLAFWASNQISLISHKSNSKLPLLSSSFQLSTPLSKWHHLHRNKRKVTNSFSFLHLTDQQSITHSSLCPGSVEDVLFLSKANKTQATHPTSLGIWCHRLSSFSLYIFNFSFSSGFSSTAWIFTSLPF